MASGCPFSSLDPSTLLLARHNRDESLTSSSTLAPAREPILGGPWAATSTSSARARNSHTCGLAGGRREPMGPVWVPNATEGPTSAKPRARVLKCRVDYPPLPKHVPRDNPSWCHRSGVPGRDALSLVVGSLTDPLTGISGESVGADLALPTKGDWRYYSP